MESKTDKVIKLLREGEFDKALQIGKTFRRGDKQLVSDIQRGWDASRNPSFYNQLGMNPQALYEKAIESLKLLVNYCIK